MERYGRTPQLTQEDLQNKVVNSGIKNDQRIMIDSYLERRQSEVESKLLSSECEDSAMEMNLDRNVHN